VASLHADQKKKQIVKKAGHVRLLRFIKEVPEDKKLHDTIVYALSQIALLGTSLHEMQGVGTVRCPQAGTKLNTKYQAPLKEELGVSCFGKLRKIFLKSPSENVREYALQTIAHLATTGTFRNPGKHHSVFADIRCLLLHARPKPKPFVALGHGRCAPPTGRRKGQLSELCYGDAAPKRLRSSSFGKFSCTG